MVDAQVLSSSKTYQRTPTFLGKPFQGSVHRKTAYNPGLQPCYFPSRADCCLTRNIILVVADFFFTCRRPMNFISSLEMLVTHRTLSSLKLFPTRYISGFLCVCVVDILVNLH